MTNRLVLLLGEFEGPEAELASVLREWSSAGLLGTVAWSSVSSDPAVRPKTTVNEAEGTRDTDLFELLTSRIWKQVSVVAVRQARLDSLSQQRFDNEVALLRMVEKAFEAHNNLEFTSFTVSIGEESGLSRAAFPPNWKVHILHEPAVRIDQAVAAQPLWDDHRHLLVALLALSTAGGFVWQTTALAVGLADPVSGLYRPLRVGRAYLRVVSAGRLTDEVLAGAFPASGPWSVPPDVPNSRAVPPGTTVPDNVVAAVLDSGYFRLGQGPKAKQRTGSDMSILEGLKLFMKKFVEALRSIPVSFVARVKGEIEEFIQKTTFGADSTVLLKFNPAESDLDTDDIVGLIRTLHLATDIDPIGESRPWEVLQSVALGAVDGGRFPENVPVPMSGSSRLIYTDPSAIGPAPDDADFTVTGFEQHLLNLKDTQQVIGPMDIDVAMTLKLRLTAMRQELAARATESGSQQLPKSSVTPSAVASAKKSRKSKKPKGAKGPKKARFAWFQRKGKSKSESAAISHVDSAPEVSDVESLNTGIDAPDIEKAPEIDMPAEVSQTSADRHRPAHPNYDPKEYVPLTVFYQGDRTELAEGYKSPLAVYDAAMSSYKTAVGFWTTNNSCDHCGTHFDHGVLYLHEPTQELVHVGHICARKTLLLPEEVDLLAKRLADLEKRFDEWMRERSGSLLWRVGQSIVGSTVNARTQLANDLAYLETRPKIEEAAQGAGIKFGTWTRRGFMVLIGLIAASVASIIFTPLPLLLFVAVVVLYFSSFIIKLVTLAREVVRAEFRLRQEMDNYEFVYARARFLMSEIVRLTSVMEQFDDWQMVIREVVHVPFGKQIGFATTRLGVEDVTRPPALILGKSRPDDRQKMKLFLSARKQTIHGGWLTEIMDIMKDEWKSDYETARMTGPADNIIPEADNASSRSIVGKRPLSDDDVYYPRTDFRRRVVSGVLQTKLVSKKAEQVAEELRKTSLDQLLAAVEVNGLGSALNDLPVKDFLEGLSGRNGEAVNFPADLVSDDYPSQRVFGPELVLPDAGALSVETAQIQVQPGVELTAAAWRVELSGPIQPLEVLRGFEIEDHGSVMIEKSGPDAGNSESPV